MRMLRRTAVLVLLSLLLAAPWASAEPAAKATGLWGLLVRIWSAAGCIVDPLGCPAQTSTDEGCRLDPLGCPAQTSSDEGCRIDPLGGCQPGQ